MLVQEFGLRDPALARLARIVHGADIEGERDTCPESAGLLAIALGFCTTTPDDHEKLRLQFHLYEAIYVCCQD